MPTRWNTRFAPRADDGGAGEARYPREHRHHRHRRPRHALSPGKRLSVSRLEPRPPRDPLAGRNRDAGRVVDDYVSSSTIAPTMLDLAGIPQETSGMAAITGRSWRAHPRERTGRTRRGLARLRPRRQGTHRRRASLRLGYPIRGIVRDDFLLLRNYEHERWPAGNSRDRLSRHRTRVRRRPFSSRRDGRTAPTAYGSSISGCAPAVELYDLGKDPDAVQNLAGSPEHRETAARLESR